MRVRIRPRDLLFMKSTKSSHWCHQCEKVIPRWTLVGIIPFSVMVPTHRFVLEISGHWCRHARWHNGDSASVHFAVELVLMRNLIVNTECHLGFGRGEWGMFRVHLRIVHAFNIFTGCKVHCAQSCVSSSSPRSEGSGCYLVDDYSSLGATMW